MDILIRHTEKQDVDFLKKWLESHSANKNYISSTVEECSAEANLWMHFYYLKSSLTATVDGEPVGIALLQLSPFIKIRHCAECSVIVSQEYQGLGVGTKLMNVLFVLAKAQFKIEIINLFVFEGSRAIKFYRDLGFCEYGEQKKYMKDPVTGEYRSRIWMQKDL